MGTAGVLKFVHCQNSDRANIKLLKVTRGSFWNRWICKTRSSYLWFITIKALIYGSKMDGPIVCTTPSARIPQKSGSEKPNQNQMTQ